MARLDRDPMDMRTDEEVEAAEMVAEWEARLTSGDGGYTGPRLHDPSPLFARSSHRVPRDPAVIEANQRAVAEAQARIDAARYERGEG
jgi:hypothetical protein